MGKRVTYWIIAFAFMGLTYGTYGQGPVQGPPEPTMAQGNGKGPCGNIPLGPDGKPIGGRGQGIPPPVGLCLPINDYLLPLLVSGILLGSVMVWRVQVPSGEGSGIEVSDEMR